MVTPVSVMFCVELLVELIVVEVAGLVSCFDFLKAPEFDHQSFWLLSFCVLALDNNYFFLLQTAYQALI